MLTIIKAIILRHVLILKREQTWLLIIRSDWPIKTFGYEWLNLAYAMLELKIAFWEAII